GTGEAAHDRAPTVVDPDGAAARVVLGHRGHRHQIERPGAEPVGRRGQRADRTDLDRIAGEVALERLVLVDAHLLQCATLEQLDERVTGDLLDRKSTRLNSSHVKISYAVF